jgi:hypothetical protein
MRWREQPVLPGEKLHELLPRIEASAAVQE